MILGIPIEDIVLDYNYTVIDVINKERDLNERIKYGDLGHKDDNIWYSDLLTSREKTRRSLYKEEILKSMEEIQSSIKIINSLTMSGHEVHLFSTYFNYTDIKNKLLEEELIVNEVTIYDDLLGLDRICKLKELEVDLYIEDKIEMIKLAIKNKINLLIFDNVYNRNHQNISRVFNLDMLLKLAEGSEK